MAQTMTEPDQQRDLVRDLLKRYGYQSQSYNLLLDDKAYFFSSRGVDGVIGYVVRAGVALAARDPVCEAEALTPFIEEFRDFCKTRGWRCCFQAVTERCESVLEQIGFGSLKVGEEPIFDLDELTMAGGEFRDLRKDINSARKKGLSVIEYRPLESRDAELERQMETLSLAWKKYKGSGEFSFLIGEPGLDDPGERKYFLAIKEGEVEAFVVCTPIYARNGIYFDLMRRKEEPARGTAQLLITDAFKTLRDQGYGMATLGTAPLSNAHVDDPSQSRIIEIALELAFHRLGYLHRYKPLYQFKEQFGPTSWEARYLAFWPGFHPVILYAMLKAYDPSGITGRTRRQIIQA